MFAVIEWRHVDMSMRMCDVCMCFFLLLLFFSEYWTVHLSSRRVEGSMVVGMWRREVSQTVRWPREWDFTTSLYFSCW